MNAATGTAGIYFSSLRGNRRVTKNDVAQTAKLDVNLIFEFEDGSKTPSYLELTAMMKAIDATGTEWNEMLQCVTEDLLGRWVGGDICPDKSQDLRQIYENHNKKS